MAALHGALAGSVAAPPLDERPNELLSAREREVLACLAQGRSNREIAATLSVTLATVKSHLVRIYAKLEAATATRRSAGPSRSACCARRPASRRGPLVGPFRLFSPRSSSDEIADRLGR